MFHLVSTANMRALRVYDSPNTWFLHASITSIRLEYQRLTFLTLVCHCFGPFFGQAKANFNDKNKIKSYKKSEKSTELSYIFNYIYQNIHVYAFVWLEKWERGMVPRWMEKWYLLKQMVCRRVWLSSGMILRRLLVPYIKTYQRTTSSSQPLCTLVNAGLRSTLLI